MSSSAIVGRFSFYKLAESSELNDQELEKILDEMRNSLAKHGFTFSQYEFLGLPSDEYRIGNCSKCQVLTLDTSKTPEGLSPEDSFDNIATIVRNGSVVDEKYICEECQGHR